MTTQALRQQLAHLADMQAALDALKLELNTQLKESQKCTTALEIQTGTWPHSGLLQVS